MSSSSIIHTEKKSITRIGVIFNPAHTDGHVFCDVLLDDVNERFTAVLRNGEAYTYKPLGSSFYETIIRDLQQASDNLYPELRDVRLDDIIDIDATITAMRQYIENSHEYQTYPNDYHIEDIMTNIQKQFDEHAPLHIHTCGVTWDDWFRPCINDGLLPNVTDMHNDHIPLIHTEGDRQCHIFCEKIAPLLAIAIQNEMDTHTKQDA